jgi:hypothetical protein
MNRRAVGYAREKLEGLLVEVNSLVSSDFLDDELKSALEKTADKINAYKGMLKKVVRSEDASTVKHVCLTVNEFISKYLSIHGVLVGAAEMRNAFELKNPLANVLSFLLRPKAGKLILSSEWNFSPSRYKTHLKHLEGFAIIGLPASEASNPLVTALAGHEFGHVLWSSLGLKAKLDGDMREIVYKVFSSESQAYRKIFGETLRPKTDAVIYSRVGKVSEYAFRQCEEIFCDAIGLFLFGPAFLYAFEYLLSKLPMPRRLANYPSMPDRVGYQLKAAMTYQKKAVEAGMPAEVIDVPEGYAESFERESYGHALDAQDMFILNCADKVVSLIADEIHGLALTHCRSSGVPMYSRSEAKKILNYFHLGLPAQGPQSDVRAEFVDIINAGWLAYFAGDLWKKPEYKALLERKVEIICELVLKSIEITEFQMMLGRSH